jgi:hypothetical protein
VAGGDVASLDRRVQPRVRPRARLGGSPDADLGGAMSQTIVVLVFIGLALWWDRQ